MVFPYYGHPFTKKHAAKYGPLAGTLEYIANHGSRGFYTGWSAEKLAAYLKSLDGIVEKEDFINYDLKVFKNRQQTYSAESVLSAWMPNLIISAPALILIGQQLSPSLPDAYFIQMDPLEKGPGRVEYMTFGVCRNRL